jgi:hypothetical protein
MTSSSKALGHSYWEHRMDVQLGEQCTRIAREVVMNHDHSAADALFDRVLSATLFSFQTNRRIFRGMIRIQDNNRWHALFGTMLQNSRWVLPSSSVERYVALSFDYVIDYLARREEAIPASLDPIGDLNLGQAKRIRKLAMSEGKLKTPQLLDELADNFFPLPETPFDFLRTSREERAS